MRGVRASDFAYLDTPGPVALAHRGGALHAPNVGRENTLAAFRTAYDLGFRYLETDVHVTADGQVVALHDERLDRVADRAGLVAELTWAQVREARVGGEPVPLLVDLLEALPEARFNIDLKAPAAVVPTARVLLRADALDRVCLGSFDQRSLARARALLGPEVCTAAGTPGVAALRLAPRAWHRWLRTPAPVLQIPHVHRVAGREITVVTPDLVRAAHALGKQVHVWTIDDPAEMHALLDLGVDGLVSDATDVLRDVLVQRGQWHGPDESAARPVR